MEIILESKALNRPFKFYSMGKVGSAIYVDTNGAPGFMGEQLMSRYSCAICIELADDKKDFKRLCKNWLNNYVRKMVLMGLEG